MGLCCGAEDEPRRFALGRRVLRGEAENRFPLFDAL
jgi:hypothetical protein